MAPHVRISESASSCVLQIGSLPKAMLSGCSARPNDFKIREKDDAAKMFLALD